MFERRLYKIHVKGYVQGVGFRWNASREAKHRGITGFIKNLPDGSVYIEAEGSAEQLNSYIDWCREGPGYVESVTYESYSPVNFSDFRIEH